MLILQFSMFFFFFPSWCCRLKQTKEKSGWVCWMQIWRSAYFLSILTVGPPTVRSKKHLFQVYFKNAPRSHQHNSLVRGFKPMICPPNLSESAHVQVFAQWCEEARITVSRTASIKQDVTKPEIYWNLNGKGLFELQTIFRKDWGTRCFSVDSWAVRSAICMSTSPLWTSRATVVFWCWLSLGVASAARSKQW